MKLQEMRQKRGVEQLDLALRVGTNAPMMSNFEHYKCLPVPQMLNAICEILQCERSEIYDDDELYVKGKKAARTRNKESNIYNLSVRLPDRVRDLLTQANLEKCGYHSIKDFVWHCVTVFEEQLKAANTNKKTTKQRKCMVANEDGNIPNQRNISINHLSIKINN